VTLAESIFYVEYSCQRGMLSEGRIEENFGTKMSFVRSEWFYNHDLFHVEFSSLEGDVTDGQIDLFFFNQSDFCFQIDR
jgi:hypothetical protein